jgi:hypothetical protein
MILWTISTAISIKHRILGTSNIKKMEIRRCLILLHPVKYSMFTRAIFIRPDNELIRESVCTCAKLFAEGKAHDTNKKYWRILHENDTKGRI